MAKVKLGIVKYTDSNGFEKPALVVGTRKTTKKDTGVRRPDKGSANLLIFSPQNPEAKNYVRWNVPQGDGPGTWSSVDATVTDDLASLSN